MDADPDRIVADGQLTMSDAAWKQARARASVIGSLAERCIRGLLPLTRQRWSSVCPGGPGGTL